MNVTDGDDGGMASRRRFEVKRMRMLYGRFRSFFFNGFDSDGYEPTCTQFLFID